MSKNNLLIIVSDEHQARAMGCAGHPFVQTPNLDALDARGTRFTNAYTPCPICVPARAAFATGKYVHQTRLWDNAMPYTGAIRGWGHALQEKNVPVESIGKLHYRDKKDPAGFDAEHLPMMVQGGVGMVWACIRDEEERRSPDARMLGDYIGPGVSKYTEYDKGVVDRTKQWFSDRAKMEDDRSWCLYVGLVAPHFPLIAPEAFYDLYPISQIPDAKLHPNSGYRRHPWVEKQNAAMDTEASFRDEAERKRAFSAYYGLTSWLDHNIGELVKSLDLNGFSDNTTIVYTSDHGDNLGARGLWGKSTLYEESVAVPLIMAGEGIPSGTCNTPVSLLDLSETIAQHFNCSIDGVQGSQPLRQLANDPDDPDRVVFSEYHAIGAVSAGYMLRKGDWKLNYYVGFEPELFNLRQDPEEMTDLASDPDHAGILSNLEAELRKILDPEAMNALAFADQAALVERFGGKESALKIGPKSATPPPDIAK